MLKARRFSTFRYRSLLLLVALLSFACQFSSGEAQPSVTVTPGKPIETAQTGGNWYAIYFSDPNGPNSTTLRGGPDRALADAIRQARASVEIAAYQLDLWSVRDALISAYRKGVTVRMVTESDNLDEPEVQDLVKVGIPVLGDRREGLMHDKFVIIDRQEVWTGSMNLTVNGAYRNDNNLIRIRSSRLAQDYLAEFEEMFVEDQFGSGSPADTPYPTLTIDGTQVEVFFSPDDGALQRLVELVEAAQDSVYFLAFSFTSDDLATAMIGRSQQGVTVSGVFEQYQYETNTGTEYENFKSAGLDVRLDGNPRNMHHKVIVIDGKIVVTGSYNFSVSAENRNDENLLIIYNTDIADLYLTEFKRVLALASP
ncbi:MAG: phospholipase D-like domain-containing protein [Chloroflexota bacterium]